MPEISRFYGIVIKIYLKDHLPAHFHAEYGEYNAMINIQTGEIIEGQIPRKALVLVQEWVNLHRNELLETFNLLRNGKTNWKKIAPLE